MMRGTRTQGTMNMKQRLVNHSVVRAFARFSGACSLAVCCGFAHADIAGLPGTLPYNAGGPHRALTASTFSLTSVRPRTFTPNGDNRNDQVVFTYDNPADAALSGKIYDLGGSLIAELSRGTSNTLTWDGSTNNGVRAAPGVYVYQIEVTGSETSVVNGVVVVAR